MPDPKSEFLADPCTETAVAYTRSIINEPSRRGEAREICFRYLSEDATNLQLRLVLAKSFYLDGYADFCVRELSQLSRFRDLRTLGRLQKAVEKYAEQSSDPKNPQVVAEGALDSELLEALDELVEKEQS